jgi:ribosomal protein S27E
MSVAAKCARCDDYELVDGPAGMLEPCPDCGPEIVVCPVHKQRVMTRGGVVAGRCWGCSNEAADGLRWLREHPIRKPVLA